MFLHVRAARLFALATGLGLIIGAYASESHGGAHGDAPSEPKAGGHEVVSKATKAELKSQAKAEAKAETKAEPKESGDKAGASVSMADLRELIDQKIAEVRATQAAAPAVRLVSRAPRARREAAHAPAAHRADGALAPVASGGDHGVASTQPYGAQAAATGGHGAEGHDLHWAYSGDTGPANWGTLKPEFQTCMLGKRQSPIDIRDGIKVALEPILFDYRPTPFRVIDNGHTIQVNVEPGNSIMVQGRRFDLVQFHFHRPSEERINGRQSDMVAHMVHKDADGKLAVIAVLLNQGDLPHPMVQLVWNSLPLEKNVEQYSPVMMDLNALLPDQKQYYTYMGSLTTPPCSEGVLWMVMKQPSVMTREQIAIFSRLYPMNARPIQPGGGRMIKDGQ
jgi:carbonic anhydrase